MEAFRRERGERGTFSGGNVQEGEGAKGAFSKEPFKRGSGERFSAGVNVLGGREGKRRRAEE